MAKLTQADLFELTPRELTRRKTDMTSHRFDKWATRRLTRLNKEAGSRPDFWQETPQELYKYRAKAFDHFLNNYMEVINGSTTIKKGS